MVVAHHDAGTLDAQLAHLALRDDLVVLVHDLHLPAVAGDPNGPHLVDVVHPQVNAARAGGLGQAVVGVILVVREIGQPVADQRGGDRLGPDVHQPPLGEPVVLQLQVPPVQGGQDVLAPGHQQPDNGAALGGHRVENGLGAVPLQQDSPAAGKQGADQCILAPVWYRGGMHRNTSSWVVSWWMASIRAAWRREECRSRMALGKPVVPEE